MTHRRRSQVRALATLAVAATAAMAAEAAPLAAQRTGTVAGRVMDGATLRPLAGAQVVVDGLDRGVLADDRGRYRFIDLPAGTYTIRAMFIGYEPGVTEVTVRAGEATEAELRLTPSAIALDAVVATVTGERRKRTLSNSVTRVDADHLVTTAPVPEVSDMLQARVAGVSVLPSSGATGAGTRIRIRGSSSIALQNDPVVYVDGVRVESSERSLSISLSGQSVSRLTDLNPEDIESIEVVRGPSAATLYGTDGANGVIRIRTRRGRPGTSSWRYWTEQGVLQDRNDYPANVRALNAAGAPCLNPFAAAGFCSQDTLQSFSPLEDERTSPFELGRRQTHGAALSGGSDRLHYYVSGEYEAEDGVLGLPPVAEEALRDDFGDAVDDLDRNQFKPNTLRRVNLRANFGGRITESLNLRVSTGYVSSDLNLPQGDDNFFSVITAGLLGATRRDTLDPTHGYFMHPPEDLYALEVEQEVERVTGSVTANYQPASAGWLDARATVGMDVIHRVDVENVPRERLSGPTGPGLPPVDHGRRQVNQARSHAYTADASASARFDLSTGVSSRTTLGVQAWRSFFNRSDALGWDIPTGARSMAAAVNTRAGETTVESITLGTFLEQAVSFRDRLFLTGAIRGDDNSAFGADYDFVLYPKAGLSYVVSEDPWFPESDFLNSLRLRVAWGRSGKQPGPTDALQTLRVVAVPGAGGEEGGVTLEQFGNADLEPEQSAEVEAGFDAALFRDRLNLELTYYDKTTRDLIIPQPLPPSAGVGLSRLANLGRVQNTGWEAALKLVPLRGSTVSWAVSLIASTNDNTLEELGTGPDGEPLAPFEIAGGSQRAVEGYPLFGYWQRPISYEDTDGNGILSIDEVEVGEEAEFIDEALPTREVAIGTNLSLFGRVSVWGLLEYKGGHSLLNGSRLFRCIPFIVVCSALAEPDTPLEHQAAVIGSFFTETTTHAGLIEDASFWKLREVGVTLFVPDRVTELVSADRATLSFTGRNLMTWTDYSGIDPEVNGRGQANFVTADLLTQPPVTRWTARLDLSF